MCLICSILIVWMCHRKNYQPLKRMSPNLTIASLIGQYLVILNIIGCVQYFQLVKWNMSRCYFESGHYTSQNYEKGDECIKEWINETHVKFFQWLMYVNSCCLQPISENLAIIPYLMRSIRIRKMFDARDQSCKTGKLPKQMI